MKIDTETVKRNVDLLALAGQFTALKRISSTGGGEYAGACPFCGGTDRFRVQPENHIWLCRHCSNGKWQDAIAFGQRLWPGESFNRVCERIAGHDMSTVSTKAAKPQEPQYKPADTAPDEAWQHEALAQVERYEAALWTKSGEQARDYLKRVRGLKDETIRQFRLGLRLEPRGISIPCFVKGKLWYVKFRTPNERLKYILLKGSKPAALFNADAIQAGKPVLFVEGEFDAMLAWQEFGDILPTVTSGSADNRLDMAAWGSYFFKPNISLILPDNDDAGWRAAEFVVNNSRNPLFVTLPDGGTKDLTDYWKAGGNLKAWLLDNLDWHGIPKKEEITQVMRACEYLIHLSTDS